MPKWTEQQKAKFDVRAEASGPVQVVICGYIGDDVWDESATGEHKFLQALKSYDTNRDLEIHINSQGGSVKDGLGIYNAIKRWEGRTTAHITGFACSIASVIPLACDRVISPKSSNWMIHDPLCMTAGNAADHQKSIEMLESCAATMAAIYSERTGKSRKEMRDVMKAETWFTGEEAKAFGLCDAVTDDPVNLTTMAAMEAVEQFRNVPERLVAMARPNNKPPIAAQHTTNNTMDKTKILALLKEHGKTPAAEATDEQILAALADLVAAGKVTQTQADTAKKPDENIIIPAAQLKAMAEKLNAEREQRLRAEFDSLAASRPYLKASDWMPRLMQDEGLMASIRQMPTAGHIGVPSTPGLENNGIGILEAYKKMKPGQERKTFALENWHSLDDAFHAARIQAVSSLSVQEQLRRLYDPRADNTYSASLVTDRLADGFITTIGTKLASLRAFSRDFGVDRMKPRSTVQVPKATVAATTQTNATNFESGDSTTTNVAVSVAQITQSFHVTNDQLNKGHQLVTVAEKNAQAFANAISDIWTALITTANYGTALQIGAAATFDASDLAPIYAAAKNYGSKNLILDGGHLAYLLPTDKFKFRLGEEGAYNFDLIAEQNRWTSATTNTVGFVCDNSAIAVASGLPVDLPSGEFIELNTVSMPNLGLTILVCHWFSRAGRVHWMSYDVMFGAAAGDTTAGEVLVTS